MISNLQQKKKENFNISGLRHFFVANHEVYPNPYSSEPFNLNLHKVNCASLPRSTQKHRVDTVIDMSALGVREFHEVIRLSTCHVNLCVYSDKWAALNPQSTNVH